MQYIYLLQRSTPSRKGDSDLLLNEQISNYRYRSRRATKEGGGAGGSSDSKSLYHTAGHRLGRRRRAPLRRRANIPGPRPRAASASAPATAPASPSTRASPAPAAPSALLGPWECPPFFGPGRGHLRIENCRGGPGPLATNAAVRAVPTSLRRCLPLRHATGRDAQGPS